MPDKAYRIHLEKGFVIAVTIEMVEGRVTGFVVRLIHTEGESERDLRRYDTAHGLPHLDLLTRKENSRRSAGLGVYLLKKL